jgi:hypothetical protein
MTKQTNEDDIGESAERRQEEADPFVIEEIQKQREKQKQREEEN